MEIHGVRFSKVITMVPLNELKDHPDNSLFSKQESDAYFVDLENSIRKHGVLEPLLVRKDGVILSGHKRKLACSGLEVREVPVRRLMEDLSQEQETSLMLEANLCRSMYSDEERHTICKKLYGDDYVNRLVFSSPGKNSKMKNIKSKTLLDAARIARDTGMSVKDAKKFLSKKVNEQRAEKARGVRLAASENEKTIEYVRSSLTRIMTHYMMTDKRTRITILNIIEKFSKDIKKAV